MIWSIIPEDAIFASQQPQLSADVVDYIGRRVLVQQGRIQALYSTDPQDFLDQRLAPGALINRK